MDELKILSVSTDDGIFILDYELAGVRICYTLDYIPDDYKGEDTDWDEFFLNHETEGCSESYCIDPIK